MSGRAAFASGAAAGTNYFDRDETYTRLGAATTTGGHLSASDDLLISGKLEVDGTVRLDGAVNHYGIVAITGASNYLQVVDGRSAIFGSGFDASLEYNGSQDWLTLGVGSGKNLLVLCQRADDGFNFGWSAQTNPTLAIHSAAQSTTEYLALVHDGTDGEVYVGAGNLLLTPASGSDAVAKFSSLGVSAETSPGALRAWNITAATALQDQQSPRLELVGNAWDSGEGGGASDEVIGVLQMLPGESGDPADSYLSVGTQIDGAFAEMMQIQGSQTAGFGSLHLAPGSNVNIGVHGATPVARQSVTGSRGGNAALASLLTALAAIGWITDNTT